MFKRLRVGLDGRFPTHLCFNDLSCKTDVSLLNSVLGGKAKLVECCPGSSGPFSNQLCSCHHMQICDANLDPAYILAGCSTLQFYNENPPEFTVRNEMVNSYNGKYVIFIVNINDIYLNETLLSTFSRVSYDIFNFHLTCLSIVSPANISGLIYRSIYRYYMVMQNAKPKSYKPGFVYVKNFHIILT